MKKIILLTFVYLLILSVSGCKSINTENNSRRGIVIYPTDITSLGSDTWIDFLKSSDLNLLGIHANGDENLQFLKAFVESSEGKNLLDECDRQKIDYEFETHALEELLPRELFDTHPDYFRMDKDGVRQRKFNMCFSSEGAYEAIEKSIIDIAKWMKPSTDRYFFWIDDVTDSYCNCENCSKYTPSEQALIYENRLLKMLRKVNPSATLAHLAYNNTYEAPARVKPDKGIFLEYAPINRDLTKPIPEDHLTNLRNNLEVFPKNSAHVLEYWLDVSRFSGWKRENLTEIQWNAENCLADIKLYNSLGFFSMTTFGAWINKEYTDKYGIDSTRTVIKDYGSQLKKYLY